jgi:hypothetical protein
MSWNSGTFETKIPATEAVVGTLHWECGSISSFDISANTIHYSWSKHVAFPSARYCETLPIRQRARWKLQSEQNSIGLVAVQPNATSV